jgi:hypothetical protein
MPEARQNSSKLAEMFAIASSFSALVGTAVDVISVFMALLSFVESAPRAYRLKASNAAPPFSTSIGTIPTLVTTDVHGDALINLGHNDSITFAGLTENELQKVIQSGHVLLH